jgi:predicted transglutaminase-like cysteine proteinase
VTINSNNPKQQQTATEVLVVGVCLRRNLLGHGNLSSTRPVKLAQSKSPEVQKVGYSSNHDEDIRQQDVRGNEKIWAAYLR